MKNLVSKLAFCEVDSRLEPDARRMMRQERFAVERALRTKDPVKIAAAKAEALRVADMWQVAI